MNPIRAIPRLRTRQAIFLATIAWSLAAFPATAQQANAQPATAPHAGDPAVPARSTAVLFVGNSLTYVNNLPALLRALGDAQGTPISTETYAAPGGTLSGEHGIGLAKRDFMQQAVDPPTLQLMRQLKAVFDPDGILNPGKLLP